jgi:hypothetical protein
MNENLIKDWGTAKSAAERAKVIKKYDLMVGVSRLRPGEVKLGIANELKMNSKKEIPALDLKGDLIIVSGNPPKIKYPFKAGVLTVLPESDDSIELPEALAKNAKASAWIHDFVNSKNPMFDGKSKEERIKMALGAYYAAHKNEALELGTDAALKNHIDGTPGQKEIEETLERRKLGDYKSTVELIKKEIPSYMDPKIMPHVAAFLSVQFKKTLDDVKRDLRPVTESLESEWLSGSIQKRKDLIKKHDLKVGISSVRPGEVKLGISNELNGRKDIYALDGNNKLIVVSGTSKSPKIRYVKENKEETIKSVRHHAIVQLATGEKNPTIREAFLESGKADLTSTLGVIDSFRTFYKESTQIDDLWQVSLKWDATKGDPKAIAKQNELGLRGNVKPGVHMFTGDQEGIVELLKVYDDGVTDFIRNSDWKGLMKHYGAVPALRGFPVVK